MLFKSKNVSFFTLLAIVFIYLVSVFSIRLWHTPEKVIQWDVKDYYAYLPAAFIYHDLTLRFKDEHPEQFHQWIWGKKLENGNYVLKMFVGASIMYMPFFLIAHSYALLFDDISDGYSTPYAAAIVFAALLYFILALVILRLVLLKYFSDIAVSFVLIVISFATNLTHYVLIEPGMTHVYSFFLFALFLFITIKFYEQPSLFRAFVVGGLLGLISLVRPTNVLIGFVFLFWNVSNLAEFQGRFLFFLKNIRYKLIIGLAFLFFWLLQFGYWKVVTGSWLYYPYSEEGFFFLNPKVFQVLFSFRKGLFIYTPALILAVIGFYYLWKQYREHVISVVLFMVANLYVVSSWWCWWYGGSYGMRALIETYAIMSLPLAAFFHYHFKTKKTVQRLLALGLVLVFTAQNIFFQYKYVTDSIHYDSMTRHAWIETIDKLRPTPLFYQLLQVPDYENALKGKPERYIPIQYSRLSFANSRILLLHEMLDDEDEPNEEIFLSEFPAGTEFSYEPIAACTALLALVEYQFSEYSDKNEFYIVCSVEQDNHVRWYASYPCEKSASPGQRSICAALFTGFNGETGDVVKCYVWNKGCQVQGAIRSFRVFGIY